MDASQTELHYEGRGYIHEIDENGKIDKDTRPPLEVIYIVKHLKYGANSFATEIRPIDGDVERTSSLVD